MSDDLAYASATTLARAIRTGELSPVEIVDALLRRIEGHEPRINAFAMLTPDLARDMARAAEDDLAKGRPTGPLHGVPVTIKDLFDVEGLPTDRGSLAGRGRVAVADSPVTARLRAAGAVILGKTTTSEFGWTGVSRSPLTGITHNPWRHGYNAGASSAGAGAAAAAGFGPLHQGSDGAGSIRMPSHFSGIFGLKPTWGLVPQLPVRNSDQVSHVGPMTRTVADAALFLNATAGPHPFDHTSLTSREVDYGADLKRDVDGLRVAYSPDLGHARVDPEVAAAVQDAVTVFESCGCHVEEATPDWGPEGPEIGRFFWSVHEVPLAGLLDEWRDRMDPGLVACIEAGQGKSADDYLAMRARKLNYVERQHRFMADWDLLVTPAVSVAAFPAERLQPEHWPQHPWDWLQWSEFCYPFNMSGLPAASVPCGFTPDGLPVGMQIVGRRGADQAVLQAAATFERARPWAHERPPMD
ncbi:MAG: amidase family protein [Gammaproteobacteria bacterium]|nr:amidase family protein [Gammaproteobacteria bacterium]